MEALLRVGKVYDRNLTMDKFLWMEGESESFISRCSMHNGCHLDQVSKASDHPSELLGASLDYWDSFVPVS